MDPLAPTTDAGRSLLLPPPLLRGWGGGGEGWWDGSARCRLYREGGLGGSAHQPPSQGGEFARSRRSRGKGRRIRPLLSQLAVEEGEEGRGERGEGGGKEKRCGEGRGRGVSLEEWERRKWCGVEKEGEFKKCCGKMCEGPCAM